MHCSMRIHSVIPRWRCFKTCLYGMFFTDIGLLDFLSFFSRQEEHVHRQRPRRQAPKLDTCPHPFPRESWIENTWLFQRHLGKNWCSLQSKHFFWDVKFVNYLCIIGFGIFLFRLKACMFPCLTFPCSDFLSLMWNLYLVSSLNPKERLQQPNDAPSQGTFRGEKQLLWIVRLLDNWMMNGS